MIARIWRGATPISKADEYFEVLQRTGVPDYQATVGNRGVYVLRRMTGTEAHFLLLTLWDSMESIQRFAGPNPESAKYYPEDESYLLELEPRVVHMEVLLHAG